MKIVVTDACIGAGQCVRAAPEVFSQSDEDGMAVLLQASPPPHLHEAVDTAIRWCPARAIFLADDENKA